MKVFLNYLFCMLIISGISYPIYSHAKNTTNGTTKTENVEDIAKYLQKLAQYEIDDSFLISQAIDNVNNQNLKDKLSSMKQETDGNIKELSSLIRSYGREAPTHSRDFKGFFMQGYTAMRGLLSDKGVMNALHTNTQVVLSAFDDALNSDLPSNVKEKIEKVYSVKKKHLDYIASQI